MVSLKQILHVSLQKHLPDVALERELLKKIKLLDGAQLEGNFFMTTVLIWEMGSVFSASFATKNIRQPEKELVPKHSTAFHATFHLVEKFSVVCDIFKEYFLGVVVELQLEDDVIIVVFNLATKNFQVFQLTSEIFQILQELYVSFFVPRVIANRFQCPQKPF